MTPVVHVPRTSSTLLWGCASRQVLSRESLSGRPSPLHNIQCKTTASEGSQQAGTARSVFTRICRLWENTQPDTTALHAAYVVGAPALALVVWVASDNRKSRCDGNEEANTQDTTPTGPIERN
jgi:hypothetical protein